MNTTLSMLTKSIFNETSSTSKTLRYLSIIHYLSIYALILIIIGTVGHGLTIIVLLRRHLRRFVTVRYLIFVSICDIISLYGWNLNNFYKFTISTRFSNIEDLSILHCRLISYMTFVALQLSSWCLTAVSLDRALSLYWSQWKQSFGRVKYTKYYILFLTTLCLAINSHILFLNGYQPNPNTVICYATRSNQGYIYPQWERVHLVLYNICPFIIMCICNTYIIYITVRSSRVQIESRSREAHRKSIDRYRQFTVLLIIVTFVFVFLTLPACIYFVFFRHRLIIKVDRNIRYLVQISVNSIQFTAHGINFFLYCFSAKSFRYELHKMFKECFSHYQCLFHWFCGRRKSNHQKRRYVNRNHALTRIEREQMILNRRRLLQMNSYQLEFFPEFQSSTNTTKPNWI